jgi:hypothetical protein
MAFRLKCYLLYSSHIVTPYSQSFYMSSIIGSKKTSMSLPACLGPDMRVVNKRYFHMGHNHGGRLNMHMICAKSKPDISWIIREVRLMSKIKLFPLSAIHRVSNLSICLVIHMPKQQLSIPWVSEHMLQAVNHRLVSHHKSRNFSLFRAFNVLIRSDILPLSPSPFFALFVGVILNLLTIIVSFVPTSIAP